MRVGFDFRPALSPNSRRRGIGKYVLRLASALVSAESDHYLFYYGFGENRPSFIPEEFWKDLYYLSRPGRLNWVVDRLQFPRMISSENLDIFHFNDPVSLPDAGTSQSWATIHDMIPYLFWDQIRPGLPVDYAYALQRALSQIADLDAVITVSEHSKRDICELTQIAEEKVHVVYPGPGEELNRVDGEVASGLLREKYGITSPFIFYVGGTDFRKNLERLIKAFAIFVQRGYTGLLVLGGETFHFDIPDVNRLKGLIASKELDNRVVMPGYLPAVDLASFYTGCDFFAFPSLYEGFGLPVLEALICGAPVITSKVASIPEVAGACAFYVDPNSVQEIAAAFEQATVEEEMRKGFVERGTIRASRFTWQRAAERLLQLYGKLG